jgi:hypothetical protein
MRHLFLERYNSRKMYKTVKNAFSVVQKLNAHFGKCITNIFETLEKKFVKT